MQKEITCSAAEYTFPQLREGVELHETEGHDYIVENLVTSHLFKITPEVYTILSLIKEGKDMAGIISSYNASAPVPISEESYINLCNSLAAKGILKISEDVIPKKKKAPIYFRVKLMSGPVINWLASKFQCLFNKGVFPVFLTASLLFVTVFILTNDQVLAKPEDRSILKRVISFMAILFFQIFHEIGHASASYRYGIKTKEVGLGFLLGVIPVFYSDLSRIWLLPPKKREIINIAGIYFDFLTSTFALIMWFLTGHYFFLMYPYVIVGTTFRNLNIFIKYDGYWVVSDLMRTHNLLEESSKVLQACITGKKDSLHMSTKRTVAMFIYGLLNYIYILVFIVLILMVYYKDIITLPSFISALFNCADYQAVYDMVNERGVGRIFFPIIFYILISTKLVKFLYNRLRKKVNHARGKQ